MNDQDIFIRNLKNLMKKERLNQSELANKLDMTVAAINNIVNQRVGVSAKFMFKVCEVFNVTMAYMFTLDEEQFGLKENVEDLNKDAIIQMQKSQIEELEIENKDLRRQVDLYDFKQDVRDDQTKIVTKNGKKVLSKGATEFELENVLVKEDSFGWAVTATFIVDEIKMGRL